MGAVDEPAESMAQPAFPPAPHAKLRNQLRPAILSVLLLTLLAGIVFPLALFAIGRPLFPRQAAGSLVMRGGMVIGSDLVGQQFTLEKYFQPRPSAAGNGYDGTASGGTNLGPNNRNLKNGASDFLGIRQLAEQYRQRNGLDANTPIPIDAVTRSASGLDPDISPDNARLQVPRVARARGVAADAIRRLVAQHTKGPQFGLLGNPRVSVLELNLALDQSLRPGTGASPR